MQNNLERTGSNWTGRTPRTAQEAGLEFFPQYPGNDYEEPPLAQKVWDVIAVVGLIAALGFAARAVYIVVVLS